MRKIYKFAVVSLIATFMLSLTSCDDLFDPALENHKVPAELEDMPTWATGLLGHAYIGIPFGSGATDWKWTEVATDDAVSNDVDNDYRSMAAGSWRADRNPVETWRYLRGSWQYINQFIEVAPKIVWAKDEAGEPLKLICDLYTKRFLGDAYGMRALYMLHLLKSHAGWGEDGQLLGIPILTESESSDDSFDSFNKPRNTFKECIDLINADVEKAIEMLAEDYFEIPKEGTDNDVPAKYRSMGAKKDDFNRVFGDHAKGRMSARIARAVRAQAALLAASPAYSEGSGVKWDQAANLLGEVLIKAWGSNPVTRLDPNGNKWYTDYNGWGSRTAGSNPDEILWRSNRGTSSNMEADMFPPTLFGKGRVNPSQNLVDAFPMANGLPITDPNSGYDPQNPYANRDPRLDLYIIHNGSQFKGTNIVTAIDGTDNNAMNRFDGQSTRTGYYLKKLLVEDVNCNPSSTVGQTHINAWIRYTEIFLDYAEAANEAWGPKNGGANGFSAYDVIKAIRQRAGLSGNDVYLETCAGDKAKMRELIRNERRIELCFEGFRFWDLRRWKVDLSKLNETVKGMQIQNNQYKVVDVETRNYSDYMYYGPVPYSEMLKFDALIQNKGWGK